VSPAEIEALAARVAVLEEAVKRIGTIEAVLFKVKRAVATHPLLSFLKAAFT
jgi:hypothetical protein